METFRSPTDRARARKACVAYRWLLILVCWLTAVPLKADDNRSSWYVRVWQSEEGLPNGNVNGLVQTKDGYLWMAIGPLTRFDGVQFERFDSTQVFPGSQRHVEAIATAHDGSLWLALDHGAVVHLDSGTLQAFDVQQPERVAQALLETIDGTIWIAYRSGLLVQIKDGRISYLSTRDGWPQDYGIPSLAQDEKGTLWFAKNHQLGVFRDGRFQTLRTFSGSRQIELAACRQGGIWICAGSQLMKADGINSLRDVGVLPVGHAWTDPLAMVEDRTGGLWIGTSDSGLFHYDSDGFQFVSTSHPRVLSLLEDREGNLWAGTGGGGLNQIQPRVFSLETPGTGLPFETTRTICEDNERCLWATTQNGLLARRVEGQWNLVSNAPPSLAGIATCVTADPSGAVWVGTRMNKIYRCKNGEWTPWQQSDGLEPHVIHGLLAAGGKIWIAGDDTAILQCLEDGRLNTIRLSATRNIQTMAEDAGGNVWAGTVNGKLFRVTGRSAVEVAADSFTGGRSIRCLQGAPDGSLWITTGGAGLGRLKDGHLDHFTVKQGLPDDYLSQVVSDGLGWLWFGSDRGVFKVREHDFDQVADGSRSRVNAIIYGRSVGLAGLQANFGYFPSILEARDRHLWMPTLTGLVEVDPNNARHDPSPVSALLKRCVVDEQTRLFYGGAVPVTETVEPFGPAASLKIPAKHHRIEFEFTALSLTAPEELSFRYRLKGIDEDWIDAGSQRNAIYSRLPAGEYRFEVTACNSEGAWNDRPAVLALSVAPFFWQTLWFRLGVTMMFTTFVVILARYISFRRLRARLRAAEQEAALQKERARIARDLHDDLGTGLTSIVLLSGLALRDRDQPGKAGVRAQEILTKARQTIKSLDEIVWAVNPTNDTVADLVDYISQFTVEFLHPAGIQCRVDLPAELPERTVSSQVRHNLFLVVKECLNNTIRHASAMQVRMHFAVTDQFLDLTIEDDGQGFTAGGSNGDGLGNMRQRMGELDGQIQIQSEPAKGTRVAIHLPWPAQKKKAGL